MEESILVGTTDGLHQVGDGRPPQLAGREVGSVARIEATRWAIVDGEEVWRSDGDEDWTRLGSVAPLRANCLLPTASGLLVGTSEAHLYSLQGEAVAPVEAFEKAPGRESWYTPWGGPPDVRSMSSDPTGPVYVNVHVGGVVSSSDGQGDWGPTIDIDADVHEVLFDPGSGLLLAACAKGLAVSSDRGSTWRYDADGVHRRYMRAVAVSGDTVVATASTGPSTDRAAVYRKPVNSEGSFELCREGLPEWFSDNIDTLCLAAKGSMAAFGTSSGAVFLSKDEGQTWAPAAEGLPPVRCVAFA